MTTIYWQVVLSMVRDRVLEGSGRVSPAEKVTVNLVYTQEGPPLAEGMGHAKVWGQKVCA